MAVRFSLTLNAGSQRGKLCVVVAPADGEAVGRAAVNKLRLSSKQRSRLRLFLWGTGEELPTSGYLHSLCNDSVVAVSLGEEYAGPRGRACSSLASPAPPDHSLPLSWHARTEQLALVEWRSAQRMNSCLGRLSTYLEHPQLHGQVVSPQQQSSLPSSKYEGHNIYAPTLLHFEQQASIGEGGGLSSDEAFLLARWREEGSPAVLIHWVGGAFATLRHEMCHARYALEEGYRAACELAWESHGPKLRKWSERPPFEL
ncbi:MAG: hypothetical protein SGPRY_008720 [Prymnesium sp.]